METYFYNYKSPYAKYSMPYTYVTTNCIIFTDLEASFTRSVPSRQDRLRDVIKHRVFPGIRVRPSWKPLESPLDIREKRARETLRRVIGEDKWQSYTRKGFIQVRGKSGKYYQIFPDHKFTHVFENGRMIDRLCVVLTGNFTSTDYLIMRYLLILNDEQDFWKRAIRHGAIAAKHNSTVSTPRLLTEVA